MLLCAIGGFVLILMLWLGVLYAKETGHEHDWHLVRMHYPNGEGYYKRECKICGALKPPFKEED